MTLFLQCVILLKNMKCVDGKVLYLTDFRECAFGESTHRLCRWSSLSLLPESVVGKCGYARYSFRVSAFAEIQVVPRKFFRPEPLARDVFVKESRYEKRIAQGL